MKLYIIRDKFTSDYLAKGGLFGSYYLTSNIYEALRFKNKIKASKAVKKQNLIGESRLEVDVVIMN